MDYIHEHFSREIWSEYSARGLFVYVCMNNVESGLEHSHEPTDRCPYGDLSKLGLHISSESNTAEQSGTYTYINNGPLSAQVFSLQF